MIKQHDKQHCIDILGIRVRLILVTLVGLILATLFSKVAIRLEASLEIF